MFWGFVMTEVLQSSCLVCLHVNMFINTDRDTQILNKPCLVFLLMLFLFVLDAVKIEVKWL